VSGIVRLGFKEVNLFLGRKEISTEQDFSMAGTRRKDKAPISILRLKASPKCSQEIDLSCPGPKVSSPLRIRRRKKTLISHKLANLILFSLSQDSKKRILNSQTK